MEFVSRLILTAALSAGSVHAAAQSNVCTNVSGQINGQIVGPSSECAGELMEIGTFTGAAGGGTFSTCLTAARQNGNGSVFFDLATTYTTTGGDTFTSTDRIVAAPVQPSQYRIINNRVNITGGTGALTDAFGFLRAHGTINIETGVLLLAYRGRLCTP